jgi:mono/diheme cytochrome c family protein
LIGEHVRALLRFGVVSALQLTGLAVGSLLYAATPPSSDPSLANPNHFVSDDGAFLYRAACQGCHMSDARGATGAGTYPALANDPRLQSALYAAVLVVNGSKAMPPLGRFLDDAQVAAVVNYVRTHFGNRYTDELLPESVKGVRR